jgi:hypothetical protein
LRGNKQWTHAQDRRGDRAGNPQRPLRWDEGVRPRADSITPARAREDRRAVQAVLPGATATEFWELAGNPAENLPADIVMPAADMVDAALAGLDMGETVTIPSLRDAADWETFERARAALLPNLSRARPAGRYLAGRGAA